MEAHSLATWLLKEAGFLTMYGDKQIRLTELSREVAESIYERHCILKESLIYLGADAETAEQDACWVEHDDRLVIELIKKFMKSGVMENGLYIRTEEISPQGGTLSPLHANSYLNKFDHKMESRGVHVIRFADDIVVLTRTPRAAERLLESSRKYGRIAAKHRKL